MKKTNEKNQMKDKRQGRKIWWIAAGLVLIIAVAIAIIFCKSGPKNIVVINSPTLESTVVETEKALKEKKLTQVFITAFGGDETVFYKHGITKTVQIPELSFSYFEGAISTSDEYDGYESASEFLTRHIESVVGNRYNDGMILVCGVRDIETCTDIATGIGTKTPIIIITAN